MVAPGIGWPAPSVIVPAAMTFWEKAFPGKAAMMTSPAKSSNRYFMLVSGLYTYWLWCGKYVVAIALFRYLPASCIIAGEICRGIGGEAVDIAIEHAECGSD